jgi:hypothetical protein
MNDQSHLSQLPPAILRRIASYVGVKDVVERLLPACPHLFTKLCNGVACANFELTPTVESLRALPLVAVDTLSSLAVYARPRGNHFVDQYRKLLNAPKLKSLFVRDLRFLSGETVSNSVEKIDCHLCSREENDDLAFIWNPTNPILPNVKEFIQKRTQSIRAVAREREGLVTRGDMFFEFFPGVKKLSFTPRIPCAFLVSSPQGPTWGVSQLEEMYFNDDCLKHSDIDEYLPPFNPNFFRFVATIYRCVFYMHYWLLRHCLRVTAS